MLLVAASSTDVTVTCAPLPAPRVMIISAEPASTGSPPSSDSVTGTPSFATASAMIAAGRACRPMADPTMTVLVCIDQSPCLVMGLRSDSGQCGFRVRLGCGSDELLGGDHGDGADYRPRGESEEEPGDVANREEHEDSSVRRP